MKHLLSVLFCTCFSIYLTAQQSVEWGNWKNWGDQGDGTYINPIIPSDYSDIDCIRVGEDYYAISSTFQFSPGMTLLHSKDLVNWEIYGNFPVYKVFGMQKCHSRGELKCGGYGIIVFTYSDTVNIAVI